MKRNHAVLTESDWSRIFEIRCRSKRGERITPEELDQCRAARDADRERYVAMERDVFEATLPFGARGMK